MKKLGLVGGMGPESTMPYYRGIVYGVQARTDKEFFPNLTIESVNVFHILRLCREKNYDAVTDYLLAAIRNLAAAGADFAALSANTAHIVYDRLQGLSPIPLLSIVEATCREAARRGFDNIGLLGTEFTMTMDFYRRPFVAGGIGIKVPRPEEMRYINAKISEELEYGIVKEETLNRFQEIISRMQAEDGIQAVILGCTELPLLLNDDNCPVPCLDTVQIHVHEIVDRILD